MTHQLNSLKMLCNHSRTIKSKKYPCLDGVVLTRSQYVKITVRINKGYVFTTLDKYEKDMALLRSKNGLNNGICPRCRLHVGVENMLSNGDRCKKCNREIQLLSRIKKKVANGYIFTTVDKYKEDVAKERSERVSSKMLKYHEAKNLDARTRDCVIRQLSKGYIFTTIEQFNKDMLFNRGKHGRESRKYNYDSTEKVTSRQKNAKYREVLTDCYIASLLNKPIKDIPKSVIETTRNILMLKRELKIGSGIKRT